jgi:multidrug efflux pump subunit AcrB
MKQLIYWFSGNHVAANLVMLGILVLGFATWFQLKLEIFPETSINVITITVPFPNSTPEEAEKGVCIPIEEAIQDLDGIDRIRSTAATGVGTVLVEVASRFPIRTVMDEVKSRVDAIPNLPESAEQPVIEELLLRSQVMSVAVSADTDDVTLRKFADQVRDGLLALEIPPQPIEIPILGDIPYLGKAINGLATALAAQGPTTISQVTIAGTRDYEISIEISENTLRQLGITMDQVADAVRGSSIDTPAGSIRTLSGEILIRTEGRRYSPSEFAGIKLVTREDGAVVTLGDAAYIRDAFAEGDVKTFFDGEPSILVNVFRVGSEDTLKVADAVRWYVEHTAPLEFPEGVTLAVWKDDSVYLRGRLDLLARNGLVGLALVFLVLALFLRPSLAILVSIGIPTSFAGAICLMPHLGVSINMISLFAFILVLGIVVDDAIVVGENVFRRMSRGEDPKIAAPAGTHEVGVVVTFGILTTMVAFTPMLGLSGVSGKIWPNIPLVVIPVLFFSLVQSKLVLPAHLSLLRPIEPTHRPGPILRFQRMIANGLESFIEHAYRPFLRLALHWRYVTISCFIALLLAIGGLVASGWVRFQFFPGVEADVSSAKIRLAAGVPIEDTRAVVAQLEAASREIASSYTDRLGRPVIVHTLSSVGTQPFQVGFDNIRGAPTDTHLGEVTIELQQGKDREISGDEINSIWRGLVGNIPGVEELTFRTEAAGGGNAIDLEVTGLDFKVLKAAVEEIKNALAEYDGIIDIADSSRVGKRELKLEILPRGEALGFTLAEVSRQVRQGFYGEEIQRLQRDRDEVKVFVRYPREERSALADLSNMMLRHPATRTEVPFSEVASPSLGRSLASIQRVDRRRAIMVTADIDGASGTNANEVVDDLEKRVLPDIRARHPQVQFAFQGEQRDQRDSISEMLRGFLIALLGMYILMAIPLRSYFQPLIIMCVIPFGMVGAVLGHMIMGMMPLSIMSLCGIVALAGVVVNDSLVLVDYVNRHRAEDKSPLHSVWEAGARRFRPIILTSLTTFAGLTPMLLETDIQARFLIPMAVSLGFGILFATVITLVLVPCIYLLGHDLANLVSGRWLQIGREDNADLSNQAP